MFLIPIPLSVFQGDIVLCLSVFEQVYPQTVTVSVTFYIFKAQYMYVVCIILGSSIL